ncbi:hypothetical protein JRQ81_014794 [Phrynocephalus forsythii]|uniref:Fibronectin type-III domain-containing protein n=1 Tax=Phrynocephalus forsythii TaxID=171643 RepID=A0A9Q0XXD7_9SAUR|nr:hypothetical protein JRQ81_014794 [Phrynocephalus forsythii]
MNQSKEGWVEIDDPLTEEWVTLKVPREVANRELNKKLAKSHLIGGSIMCYGRVWTEPASLIPLGQNISVNCHSDKKFCQNAKLYLVLNNRRVQDRLVTVLNKTTIQLRLLDYKTPFSTVQCNVECSQEDRKIVCGTQFCMGSPPDQPANLTCVIHEHLDNMTCTWYPGQDTYLNTKYKLHLKSLQTEENKTFSANSASAIIPLSQLQKNQTFSVLVCAENELGTVYSDALHIDLNTIVIPETPLVIQNTTVYSPSFKTIIQWQKRTAINETYCEERYKEMASKTWQVREWNAGLKTKHRTEYNLEANTMYEFQVRCKLMHNKGVWSNWTESVVYVTPEAEVMSISVTAHNSKGSSSPANITVKQQHLNYHDGGDYDVGVLWGTAFGVGSISLPVLVLVAKKSWRKRVTIVLTSVAPQWLFEDYPKLQNSSVIRTLQEESGPVIHSSTSLFSDYEEAVITKVEEVQGQKSLDVKKRFQEAVSEKINASEDISASSSDMVESNGYKPQVSHKAFLENVFSNTYKMHSPNLDAKLNPPTLPVNSLMKDYTSPLANVWPAICPDESILLFEKVNLVLNSSKNGQSNIRATTEEEPNTTLAHQWASLLSDDNTEEQTFIPDELLSCLKAVNGDPTDVMSYCPQNIGK